MQKDFRFKIISEGMKNGVSITCRKYNISRTLYYRWLKRYKTQGLDGLADIKKEFTPPNKTDQETEQALLDLIKEYPDYGPRALNYLFEELGYTISESAAYNIMKRHQLSHRKQRLKFAKEQGDTTRTSIPPIAELSSGKAWIFWITDYGHFENIGNLYAYTLFDLKSKIAGTRLYQEIAFRHFEALLTTAVMPVAKTLEMNIDFMCFLEDNKLLQHLGKGFKPRINKIILDNGFDFDMHIIPPNNQDLALITDLQNTYTDNCLSFLIPLINAGISYEDLKTSFQAYVKDYNLIHPSTFHDGRYSPVAYHNKVTNTKLILPIWAYMNRRY